MKKGLLLLGFIALAGAAFVMNTDAASVNYLAGLTPPGYLYLEPGDSVSGCLRCAHQASGWKKNTHLENVIGVKNAVDIHGAAESGDVESTGIGWIDSKHATSMNGASANTYCAYCHAPTYEKVTDDSEEGKFIKKDKPGVSCTACHCGHGTASRLGTRFTNYLPGGDPSADASYKARHMEDGKAANKQCLFCHGSYHGFAVEYHATKVKSGDLRCVDCHMAVLNELSGGLEERYHNMKVQANGPDSCMGECHVHSFKKKEMAQKCAELLGAHSDKKNKLPSF